MEYAQQTSIISKAGLDSIQRNQFMALRIIFGITWHTSKTAMIRLACLESAECRNLILNANFVKDRLDQEGSTNPTSMH